jgi:hypothetical protein
VQSPTARGGGSDSMRAGGRAERGGLPPTRTKESVTCERIPASWRFAPSCGTCLEPIDGEVHTDWCKQLTCKKCCPECNREPLAGEVVTISGKQGSLW